MTERTGSFDNKLCFGAIIHNNGGIDATGRSMAVDVVEDLRNGMQHFEVAIPDGMTDYHQITVHVRTELRTQLGNPKLSAW